MTYSLLMVKQIHFVKFNFNFIYIVIYLYIYFMDSLLNRENISLLLYKTDIFGVFFLVTFL